MSDKSIFARFINREQLRKWNVRSSTLTLTIYILYGVFYRVDLAEWYNYSLMAITFFNLILVGILLWISIMNSHLVDHFKTAVFLGLFRLLINVVLLLLIVSNAF